MSNRVNRAFYSEPLVSFPGRLHITVDKCYVEVLIERDGKRKFCCFSIDEFSSLIDILKEQKFYRKGFEKAYEHELYNVSTRAKHIQNYLFKKFSRPSPEAYLKEKSFGNNNIPETDEISKSPNYESESINTEEYSDSVLNDDTM